ncbi:glycosyltransferase family 2 protein [Lichenicoccus sp.]|uniref:glycosyltransferase family 2 protein n=1 Tax=Lichenicoccus sp. TaxID=2781899 RepID=UPI003D0EC211
MFREQGAIGPTLRRLPRDVVSHAIVVDGGSRDDTVAEAEAAGGTVIVESRRGYGRACASGVSEASRLGAAIVLFLDGDGSDEVERASAIIGPVLRNEADLVLAWRSAPGREPGSMGRHQVFAGWLIGLVSRLLTGTRYRDMSAFRAIRIEVLERLRMTEMTYGWNLEMQLRAAHAGLRIREIELPYRCRLAGSSKVAGNWRGTLRTTLRLAAVLSRTGRAVLADRRRSAPAGLR